MRSEPWRRTSKSDPDSKFDICEQSPYYHDEVKHPFVDDTGAPVEYMFRPTKEKQMDLVAPGKAPWVGVFVAYLILLSFGKKQPEPAQDYVPCYIDGDVQNCALANLYWGKIGDPQSGAVLAGLPEDFEYPPIMGVQKDTFI